ncbi:MAG: signal recognition particle-docking protein FtsY [Lachnospiraceae bacterium]|nr:signal recognition particle-docking protein FtsY [Lachnospiraceae bacterium]
MFFWKKKKKNAEELEETSAEALEESLEEGVEFPDEAETDAGTVIDAAEEFASEAREASETDETDLSDEAEESEESDEPEESEEDEPADDEESAEKAPKKKGFFARLFAGMSKTRSSLASGLRSLFRGSKIDEDFYEELEEILIMADIGVSTTGAILDGLREKVKEQHIKEPAECQQLLMDTIKEQMAVPDDAYEFENQPSVIMMVGVNGVGKTTTAGKIAGSLKAEGKRVMLAAADTFRAAATEQLTEWSHRAGCEIISAKEGADPAAVVFDAVTAAKARKVDVLICDTAGRLHNKKNLMEELGKMNRVIDREYPQAHRETFVVLDGTTGQNALVQAREFNEIADITGIVITKLDGTAKGGIAIAIQKELGIPVKYIGVGEKLEDMQKFDPDSFVEALFEPVGGEDEN